MHSEKFFNIYFHEHMFFQMFVAKGDSGQFFLEVIAYKQYNFMVLIFYFKSIFQRNENRFISLFLKAKQQQGIQLA